MRHAQVFRLAARHLAVELGVAEQRSAATELADLRRLALRVKLLIAHEAVPATDIEGNDHAVAGLDVSDSD